MMFFLLSDTRTPLSQLQILLRNGRLSVISAELHFLDERSRVGMAPLPFRFRGDAVSRTGGSYNYSTSGGSASKIFHFGAGREEEEKWGCRLTGGREAPQETSPFLL